MNKLELGVHEVTHWKVTDHFGMWAVLCQIDPFQRQGAPCFEPPANDEDWTLLFGTDPEEGYEP